MSVISENKKACIVVNPISGGKDKRFAINIIKKYFPERINYELILWERREQKDEIIKKIREQNFDIVVAAGGDGTINEVAQAIIGTKSALAIIPLGSGNGLARHLGVPLETQKAIELIGSGKEIFMDACTANGKYFFCTSGIGFDAFIGKLFAQSKTRGLLSYLTLTFSNFIKYKSQEYSLNIDGKQINTKAFLITFANASQYGNNVFIAPQADISDGYIDITVLKPFKIQQIIFIIRKMLNKTLHLSKYAEVYKGQNITVTTGASGPIHIDGEPVEAGTNIQYKIFNRAVKVIVP